MKAVILAAGKSSRTYPLTETRPKPLLKIANKFILQHTLEQLKGIVKEAIIIIGYKGEMIRKQFKDSFEGIKITYIEQKEQLGSGHALLSAKEFLQKDKEFLVMNGDDIFFSEDIKNVIKSGSISLLVKKVSHPERFAAVIAEKGKLKKLVEKPESFVSNLANTGMYLFDKSIFSLELTKSSRGEFEIVDYIIAAKEVNVVEASQWFPISYPWDLLAANAFILSTMKSNNAGTVEPNVVMKNNISIGKGTVIKSGTYIEGPAMIGEDCVIGPNAYIRASTSIGNNCKIGHEVEIKNSIIMDNSAIPHLSYVGDSVIGENCNIAAGSITANFRHDAGLIRSSVMKDAGDLKDKEMETEELVITGLHKFGPVLGDNVKLGIKTIIYPGRKIWAGRTTLPGEIVKEDVR